MGKIIKSILAIVIVAVLVTVAMPALTGALYGAFGGTVAAGSTAAAAAAASSSLAAIAAKVVAGMVVSLAAGLASKLLLGTPKSLNQASFGRLQSSVDPTTPRKIVFGTTAAGADERFHELTNKNHTYIEESKDPGDYLYRTIALASHKVHAIKQMYLDDVLSYTSGSVTGKYNNKDGLYVRAVTEGSSSNSLPMASGLYWTATATFTGCAYLQLRQKLDSDIYPNGFPSRITTIVDGCPVYDPRLDSSVGGSGLHRANDQSTWSFVNGSDEIGRNPALALLTYLIGWKINGRLAWGMGIPAARIDIGNFITYANLCDELVSSGSILVKRYQCDCILSTADSHETNINIITGAMGSAKMIDTGGLYQLVGGYNDLDGPVFTFTENDIIGKYEWKPSAAALRQRYNIARGRFTNPDKLYQFEDWGQIEVDALADGIPRTLTVDLVSVTRAAAAQRIAKQLLVRNAYTGTFTAIFGPRAFAVQVGSLVRLVIPNRGWDQPGKLFRVIDQTESTDLIFQMTLQEEDAAIYAWDEDEELELPPDVRPPAYDPNSAATVESLAANARQIIGSYGETTSQIDITWQTPDAAVDGIQFEVREVGGTKWQGVIDRFNPNAGEFTFAAMAGGIQHEIRARYIMYSGMGGEWSTVQVTSLESIGNNNVVGFLTDESVTFEADSGGNII